MLSLDTDFSNLYNHTSTYFKTSRAESHLTIPFALDLVLPHSVDDSKRLDIHTRELARVSKNSRHVPHRALMPRCSCCGRMSTISSFKLQERGQ